MPNPDADDLVAKTRHLRIDAQAAIKLFDGGALAIDVRSDQRREEFGLIPGAVPLDRDKVVEYVQSIRASEGSARPVVLFCMSERGSAGALSALEDAGQAQIHDVDGGFRALAAAGIKTEPATTPGP